ncbi:MAG: phosphotransferase, partial [Actinomycetota bacterium]|nr:phosphotransferase [Actinomycetota bacterium]
MRPPWEHVPAPVRAEIEDVLGFPVVRSESQSGGFSPGVAARVHGPDGEQAFVKAVSTDANPATPEMHRDEARFTALLPPNHPSPRLLGSYDDGTWVALVLEAVDGRPPSHPWNEQDLGAAVEAIVRQAGVRAVPELPTVVETHGQELVGWRSIAAERPHLTGWEDEHLSALTALEPLWEAAATGDDWLHLDSRGDNMLVRPDGSAVLVDWPWSCRGAAVFDAIGFVPAAVRDG